MRDALPDPVRVLMSDSDPVRRSRAHTVLGTKALDREDLNVATAHLREAVDLDPTDEVPRKLLERIEAARRPKRRWLPF